MGERVNNPMPIDYLLDARRHAYLQSYKQAFYLYLTAVHDYPHIKKNVEFEIRVVMMRLNEQLAAENKFVQIFENFQAAMNAYPGNVNLLNDIGKYLLRNNFLCEALCHFEKALEIDKSLVNVQKQMDCTKRLLFAKKNFRFLNDNRRYQAYLQALQQIMCLNINAKPERGVLGHCSKCCVTVSATDPDFTLTWARVASKILRRNIVEDAVITNKATGVPNITNTCRDRTLLIVNKYDGGLLGEHLLLNLRSAWEKNLAEYGLAVPGRADFYVAGANCNQILKKYQLAGHAKELLRVKDLFVHKEVSCSAMSYNEEEITSYRDLKFMTHEYITFQIDFNSYNEIVHKLSAVVADKAYLTATSSGEVNVLVGWFTLAMVDDITITTNPRSSKRSEAWLPAVFFDFIPKWCKKGETFCAQFSTFGGLLKYLNDCRKPITRVSTHVIGFLNDDYYINEIMSSVQTATVHLTQMAPIDEIDIADLSPFPLFGMKMLERGVRSLVCIARNRLDRSFIQEVFSRHNICMSRVKILMSRKWNLDAFQDKLYHAIFCNSLDMCGGIDLVFNRLARQLKHSCLISGGLFMPANIILVGQLISSKKLDTENRVSEKDKLMLPLAKKVNFFTVSQTYDIDPSRLEYDALTVPLQLALCCRELKSSEVSIPIQKDGICNAILCWYEIELIKNGAKISTGRNYSFINSTAFLLKTPLKLHKGDNVTVVRCVDQDGSYKLDIDLELL